MTLKTFKPYTKSTRGTILVDKADLWKGKPFKKLVKLNIYFVQVYLTSMTKNCHTTKHC